ncbi:MAG: MBOAT family protein [Alistipes sp.]|nr:MBOAT family protein [Alistipes sp.]
MLFHSMDFLIFFPVVTLVYFIMPKKMKTVWLLIASYYFYMCWNPKYALLIAFSTLITYLGGLLLSEINGRKTLSKDRKNFLKKCVAAFSVVSNLGILAVFKYADFFLANLYGLLHALGFSFTEKTLDLLLPVGISFYTFQALGYTIDVYRGVVKAEKNLIRYGLFVSFFPQLVAGPIERSSNLLEQIQKMEKETLWNWDDICGGLFLMVWGFFQKLVIADRAAIVVNTVYNNYTEYGLVGIALATFFFAFQVYCDFDGYTNIARGAAQVLGIRLMKNFRQPYFAADIRDFWRRWHISLTSWFTDYLYIPLGGSRKSTPRRLLNILIVFTVSGLWHGARWNFVVWGLLHALFQCISVLRKKNGQTENVLSASARLRKTVVTFVLTDFAWLFFRADNMGHAAALLRQMVSNIWLYTPGSFGLTSSGFTILTAALIVLFAVDLLHEKNVTIRAWLQKQECWFRYALYLALIWSVILLGVYGTAYTSSQFIYFQF